MKVIPLPSSTEDGLLIDNKAESLSNKVPVPVPLLAETLTVPPLSVIAPKATVKVSGPSIIASSLFSMVMVFVSPTIPVNVNVASLSV